MSPTDAALVATVALTAVIGLALILGRPLVVRFGRLEAKLDGIDKAVNSQPSAKPSLYEQAETAAGAASGMEECRDTLNALKGVPRKVDALGVKLDDHLAQHQQGGA